MDSFLDWDVVTTNIFISALGFREYFLPDTSLVFFAIVQPPVWLGNVFLLFLMCSRSGGNKLSYFSFWPTRHIGGRRVGNSFAMDNLCSMIASVSVKL